MEFIEANPLPAVCRDCAAQECDECDHLGERWVLPAAGSRRLERKARERAAARLRRTTDDD